MTNIGAGAGPGEFKIPGRWFDGHTSTGAPATLTLSASGAFSLDVTAVSTISTRHGVLGADAHASAALGNTPRQLLLHDGSIFESNDPAALNTALIQVDRPRLGTRWLHALEQRLWLVALSALLIIAIGWTGIRYGLPWLSDQAAARTPASVTELIGEETLTWLDREWMQPSLLPQPRLKALRQAFAPVLAAHPHLPLRVVFRRSEAIGANALALPDGTLVFTDDLVRLAASNEELVAILAHEIGHIERRHALRGLYRQSALMLLIVMVTGDISSTSSLAIAAPALLLELHHSRAFETEADQHALRYLLAHDIDPGHFVRIMEALEAQARTSGAEKIPEDTWHSDWSGYLSTHPLTAERLQPFRAHSQIPAVRAED